MAPKLFYLLWKDLVQRRNHLAETVLEVIFPLIVVIILNLSLKSKPLPQNEEPQLKVYEEGVCSSTAAISGNVMYEPLTAFTTELMTKAACYAGLDPSNLISGNVRKHVSNFTVGVEFHIPPDANDPPKILNYTLFPTKKIWSDVGKTKQSKQDPYPHDNSYFNPDLIGLVQLQRGIDAAYMDANGVNTHRIRLISGEDEAALFYLLGVYFAFFFAITFMVSPIVSRIVTEKHSGSKEMMLMMGVARWELWVSKAMDIILFNMITISGMVLFLYVPLTDESLHLNKDPLAFWCIAMYGMISVMCFLFFMSSIFTSPVAATFITQIFWLFAFFFTNIIIMKFKVPYYGIILLCFLPHIALMKAVMIILKYDLYSKDINLTEEFSDTDKTSLKLILIMFTGDIALYLILAVYLDRVNPGKYGVPLPFYFLFQKSFWRPKAVTFLPSTGTESQTEDSFETVPRGLTPGVSVKNVSKVYRLPRGHKVAVDNVTIDFYNGEISGLLGHNGAGKTTLFSMISGLTYPSSGKIIIDGYDLSNNLSKARKSLGLCPQFDMLFDDLTAYQIIVFYALIKGVSLSEAKVEARALMDVLKLSEVEHTKACKLSGGQRRKVSLAIALIGGSKVLLLDEPSSGMDPEIRREIWQILLVLRGERTMILTTHFMEEADALCDRIAIMNHGKVRCYGTPMYLKSKFGKGYVLSVVVLNGKYKSVVDYVKQTAGAKLRAQNVRTLTFEIPEKEVRVFPNLFSGLEDKQKNREIASYAVSFSALEDVFLRFSGVGDDTEPQIEATEKKAEQVRQESFTPKSRSKIFFLFHILALMFKKIIMMRKDIFPYLMFCIFAGVFLSLVVMIKEAGGKEGSMFKMDKDEPEPRPDKDEKPPDYGPGDDYDDFDFKSQKVSSIFNFYPSSLILFSNNTEESKKRDLKELAKVYRSDVLEVSDVPEGVLESKKKNFNVWSKKKILGIDYLPGEVNLYYNNRTMYVVPTPLNFVHNFLLKSENSDSKIRTRLNFTYTDKASIFDTGPKCRLSFQADFSGFQTLFYMVGPLSEKFSGSKDLQLMFTSAFFYWITHLLFDLFTFFVYISIVYVGIAYAVKDQFMLHNVGSSLWALTLWGCGLILISYLISVYARSTTAAFTINISLYTIGSFIMFNLIKYNVAPRKYRYIHPNCLVKLGFYDQCSQKSTNFLNEMIFVNCLLFGALLLIDTGIVSYLINLMLNAMFKVSYESHLAKDEFVVAEEDTVRKTLTSPDRTRTALIALNLRRWFCKRCKTAAAVKGVSFVVHRGECFGLLGVNGAGKTTTFRMLTGILPCSGGSIYICSKSLNMCNKQMLLHSVGYCPQNGGLIYSFKGRELLIFYALLKGVKFGDISSEVKKWVERVDLKEYEYQKCGQYSGGNQRKLSTAVSLIGSPLLVFLDEPTTGVDPAARRTIWSAIENIQKEGQSVVLTSHSMEECEALCSRLGIMVDGKFRCIGEITTIKNRFGQGYCIELKLSIDFTEKSLENLKKAVQNAFDPGCELVEEHLTVLQYYIKNKNLHWSDVFSRLHSLKNNHSLIESYSASSTTLEQIFIYFAKNK